jgi:hypothetical protein
MSSGSPLDDWRFLVGKWKSRTEAENQFGEKGVVEGEAVTTFEPSEKFIMTTGESRNEGQLLNRSVSILFYDPIVQKFRRKTFFSYGFVNNEVESSRGNGEIIFDITMEPLPKQFEGTRWRSFMRKISDTKIAVGLEVAKGNEDFKSYGETILTKVV